jgi:hypothetical protein
MQHGALFLHTSTGVVTALPGLRQASSGLAAAIQGNNLIVSGGGNDDQTFATVEQLDLRSRITYKKHCF